MTIFTTKVNNEMPEVVNYCEKLAK